MKHFYALLLALSCATMSIQSKACVDYHPDSVRVIVTVDTTGNCRLEVKITNLNMFGGSPNEFCSCGIINSYDLGPDKPFFIDYVVFVDSASQVPIDGFDPFGALVASSDAWETVDPADFDWSGFVAMVNQSGILAGQQVELVIRGHYEYAACGTDMLFDLGENFETFILGGGFGTDAWNEPDNTLMNGHLDITYFADVLEGDPENVEWNGVDLTYFEALDAIVLGVNESPVSDLSIFPNPTQGLLNITLKGDVEISVVNQMSQVILNTDFKDEIKVFTELWPAGLYLVQLRSNSASYAESIIVE